MTSQARSSFTQVLRVIHLPAMKVLNRLRYLPKFAIVAIVLLVPTLLLSYQQYNSVTHDIKFNAGEGLGMVFMDPMHDLLDAQERHWVAAVGRATGHGDMGAAEASSETRANQLIAKLEEVGKSHRYDDLFELFVPDGANLVYQRLQDVKSAWATALEVSKKGTAAEIHAAHASALAISSDFVVNFVSNYSNLILDPDLDSYWLMDFAIAKGPTIGIDYATAVSTALLGQTGNKTEWAASLVGSITDASLLVGYTETINLATSIGTTKNYGQNARIPLLKGPYDELKAANTTLSDIIKATYVKPLLEQSAAAVPGVPEQRADGGPMLAAAMVAFDKLDKYYDAQNVPLSELIERRVDNYKGDRLQGIIFTILAIVLPFWLFAALYLNIKDSIGDLGVATQRMIAGTTEHFASDTKDEIGEIVDDFNKINVALVESRELQRRVADENAQTQANIVDMLQVVSDASDGNLTVRAQTTAGSLGNVADAFNLLMESLERLVGDVSKQVSESEKAVNSISQVARKMAQGASNQAKEVGAARQLVDDVARQIAQVSTNAEGASQATKRTAETAESGEKAVENVINGMESLRANVQSGAKKMKNLGDRSMEITSIVGTISRISEQTNMLALNAAIEAARAGEHGRGFSVVADEVRKLAERATNATKDIEKLVKAINADTSETIKAIEQQTQVVEEESRTVGAAGESLRKIRAASDQSAGLVAGITTVARTQVDHAQRVAKTMEAVSQIANDTQQGADSTVATVNELVRLSSELRKSIGQFRVSNGAR
jgi:methyl-accepting chemotaxis protein